MISFVFLMCVVGMVAAEVEHDDGEYGHWTTWRKALCDKADEGLYTEMDTCHHMEEKIVVDAANDCAKEAALDTEGKMIPFMNAACKDVSIFKKFDDCFDEYEANSAFSKEMELKPEAEKCYRDVLEKHALEALIKYLDEY